MKGLKFMLVIILCAFAENLFSQERKLPDFSKAVQIDLTKLRTDTISLTDGRQLKLLNACLVGDYEVEFYTIEDNVLYRVFSQKMSCVKSVGYFEQFSKEERYELSENVLIFGVGHWYAKIDGVGCGWLFEYHVTHNSVVRGAYEFGCK